MPLSQDTLERQLELAKAALAEWSKSLEGQGVAAAEFRKDPKWRSLNADCVQVQRRLRRVAEIQANNAEVEQRKQARVTQAESA